MSANRKVVIVIAVNGGMQQDRDGAKIPVTPEEIAEAARICGEAGAAVVHFHARDENKRNSGDPKIYSETIQKIRDRTDILIQTTNGIGIRRDPKTGELHWPSDEERLALLNIEPRQDLFGIAAGSMDFYHPEGGYPEETPYVNTHQFLKGTIPAVLARGASLEIEVTEASALHRLRRLAEEGLFDPDTKNIWLLHGGGFGATPPIARNVIFSVDEGFRTFPQAKWSIVGTGKHQFTLATLGLSMGCDLVRIGFEDSVYLANGEVAEHNHQLVEETVRIAKLFGREPASVDEAREILNLGPASQQKRKAVA
jgi:3-keto-5-aminohexanoate cleavage enzyme